MEDKQLEDFIATYPSINENNIQALITAKYEFAELASTPNDPLPSSGEFYNHQKLLQRYAKVWDRAMIISETGTGKSYLSGALGEIFRIMRKQQYRGIKKVLILVKGETQMADMINTLLWKSTNKYYITQGLLKSSSARSAKNNATRALGSWYEIMTYGVFNGKVSQMTNEQIVSVYSDYLIIIDEIHNFRVEGAVYDLEDLLSDPSGDESYVTKRDRRERIERGEENEEKKKKGEKKKQIYKNVFRLTHLPNRIKVFGMTASVVIKSPNEFAQIMNLVLPIDRQFPPEADIDNMSVAEMSEYVRGMISYVRSLDSGIKLVRSGLLYEEEVHLDFLGSKIEYLSNLTLYPVYMGEHQTLTYLIARLVTNQSADNFRLLDTAAASWVYPDGTWGKAGFDRHYEATDNGWWRPKDSSRIRQYYHTPIEKGKPQKKHIGILSAKDATIIDIIKNTNGVVVIYDHIIHGGVLDLAIALSNMGYERFHTTESVFKGKTRDKREDMSFKANFKPKDRFAIFHDNKNVIPHILDVAGSYENRNGAYIKVFIITDASKEGISISNMKAYIQRSGVWNSSDEYQAQSRGIRSSSHDDIIEDKINELMSADATLTRSEARKKARIQIKGYFLNAVPAMLLPSEEEAEEDDIVGDHQYAVPMDSEYLEKNIDFTKGIDPKDEKFYIQDYEEGEINYSYIVRKMEELWDRIDVRTLLRLDREFTFDLEADSIDIINGLFGQTDLYLYQISQWKYISYKRLLRKLKKLALDCHIHYARNVRPDDLDYSSECDFKKCKYKCFDEKPVDIDYTTYDIYYLDEVMKVLSEYIIDYFSRNSFGTVKDIYRVLHEKITEYITSEYSERLSEGSDPQLDKIINQKIDHLTREENIKIAITNMVVNKTPIRDRYGYTSYVREDHGVYYSIREFPSSEVIDDRSLSFYSSTLLCKNSVSIVDSYRNYIYEQTSGIWDELSQIEPSDNYSSDLINIISNYKVENEIYILENAIIESHANRSTSLVEEILRMYKNVFYKMIEPRKMIERKSKELRNKSVSKAENEIIGKQKRYSKKSDRKEEELDLDEEGETIYFHAMFSHVPEKSKYRMIPRIKSALCSIRVYKASENVGWREANPIEQIIYRELVRKNIEKLLEPYEKHEIYGMYMLDGSFSIRDKSEEDESTTNNKRKKRGRSCDSYTPCQCRNYMWTLGIRDYPEDYDIDLIYDEAKKEWMFDKMELNDDNRKIMSKWDYNQVLYYYLWDKEGRSFDEINKMWDKDENNVPDVDDEEINQMLLEGMVLEIKKDTKCSIDIEHWDMIRIEFYYVWTFYKSKKDEICDLIVQKMERDGILLRWRQN